MIITDSIDKDAYAKTMHGYPLEEMKQWAKEAQENLNASGTDSYAVSVSQSERKTRMFVEATRTSADGKGFAVSIVPAETGKAVENAKDLADMILAEFASRDRSRGYVKGEVDGSVFEGKYIPPEAMDVTMFELKANEMEEEEEDRAC